MVESGQPEPIVGLVTCKAQLTSKAAEFTSKPLEFTSKTA